MAVRPTLDPAPPPELQFEGFENLMPFRVNDILLVSSLYDSFILREDGRLNELLMGESLELDIHQVPGITHVPSGAKALELARSQPRFNLIVTNLQVLDMDAAQLASEIKAAGLDVPVIVLAYDYREIKNFIARNPQTDIERIFLWQGNARILISIVKYIEDKRNVLHDTHAMSVPVMLVVEDDIRYYSLFLPVIYTELISQSRRLLSEGLNVAHKLVRMRARPKILLCSNYEDAEKQVLKYRDYLLGVVSDVEFPRGGELTPEAGFALARMVRQNVRDVPIVLQSGRTEFMGPAHRQGYSFLQKRSPTLLGDLRRIMVDEMGFGDFIFRLPDGKTEVGRAVDLNALETLLDTVPEESLAYHAERNHFSHWLMTRTEFALAQKLRPRKVSDFARQRAPAARPHRIHCRLSPRANPDAHRRIQFRNISAGRFFLPADRRRVAGGKGARPRFRPASAAPAQPDAQVSRNSHCRAAHPGFDHRLVRQFPARKQPAEIGDSRHRRPGNRAALSGRATADRGDR